MSKPIAKKMFEGYLYEISDYEFYDYIIRKERIGDKEISEIERRGCRYHGDDGWITCDATPVEHDKLLNAISLAELLEEYRGLKIRITIEVLGV